MERMWAFREGGPSEVEGGILIEIGVVGIQRLIGEGVLRKGLLCLFDW